MDTDDIQGLAELNIAIAQQWAAYTSDWDTASSRDLKHPDVVVEFPWNVGPYPRIIRGAEESSRFAKSWAEFAPTDHKIYDLEIHAFVDDPNELFIEFKADMKLNTGAMYTNEYLARMSIRDGKIVAFKEWPDPVRVLKALGGSINEPTNQPNYRPA